MILELWRYTDFPGINLASFPEARLWTASGLLTIWTQLREAAGGPSERGAIQGNRAS